MEISRQTREVIASNDALARENVRAMEASTDQIVGTLNEGFERLSYGLDNISAGISELNATFHWGFGQVIASLGHMNDALSELIKIAKTPVQTVAFNHFEIARDAFRQGLYSECLDELEKAIAGDHTSAGYKLEWRFHQMKGMIRLGFADGDMSLIDLAGAEDSFLMATRYGKTDYPEDAGRASLSVGWAAYCQGKMKEALAHTELAMSLHPGMGEAFFQAAKVQMAMGQVDLALPVLGKAIDLDRFYALKAAGDGDFQKHDDRLRDFLDALRKEKYRQCVPKVKAALEKIQFWREHSPEAKNYEVVKRMDTFISTGGDWPLLDMLNVVQNLKDTILEIENRAKDAIIIISSKIPGIARTLEQEEEYPEEETYEEKVVVKPGGFFRRAVTEKLTKTRVVMKTRKVKKTVDGIKNDIFDGLGKPISSIEFCPIPAGKFMMGEGNEAHPVTLTKGFFMAKYPVTQAQRQAVMGENPSNFKGQDLPVEQVSWEDCQRFINKLNQSGEGSKYRLPTEAEWEYACRAGSTTDYCFGDVGKKKPNAWGLYDMHVNVWEWCQDWYGDYPNGPVTDPTGPNNGSDRVVRGGGWCGVAGRGRSADRHSLSPGARYRIPSVGFRLACLQITSSGK